MSNSAQASASSRIAALLDENSFVEVGAYIKMCIRDRTMDMTIGKETVVLNLDGDVGYADPGQPVTITAPDLTGYTLAQ